MTRWPAISLLAVTAACAGQQNPLHVPRLPALETPETARSHAIRVENDVAGADVAWAVANDRALARRRLQAALDRGPSPSVLLRLGLLELSEYRPRLASTHLTEIIRTAPGSEEAEIALVVLLEWVLEQVRVGNDLIEPIERALEAGHFNPTTRPLAAAVAHRIATINGDPARATQALAAGGWRALWITGPIAPRVESEAHRDIFRLRISELEQRSLRGIAAATRRSRFGWVLAHPVARGEVSGFYVAHGCFDLKDESTVRIEVHLPRSGRVTLDRWRIGSASVPGPKRRSATWKLGAGEHCVRASLPANAASQFAISILADGGTPVVLRPDARATATPNHLAIRTAPTSAQTIINRLLHDRDQHAFGRALGSMMASSNWYDDPGWEEALLEGTAETTSAALHMRRARFLQSVQNDSVGARAAFARALELDETSPAALALAELAWRDEPERALALVESTRNLLPHAAQPYELIFRIKRRLEFHADAIDALEAAVSRNASPGILERGAQYYRSRLRSADAKRLETLRVQRLGGDRQIEAARAARASGDRIVAAQKFEQAAAVAGRPSRIWAELAEMYLAAGEMDQAVRAARRALDADDLEARARGVLFSEAVAAGRLTEAQEHLRWLRLLGRTDIRKEIRLAMAMKFSWLDETAALEDALRFDARAFLGDSPNKDPRWRRWKRYGSVTLLDRVVDQVWANGQALSVQHSIVRLQTKEATDDAGEINLPPDALPLSLRTLKGDGTAIEVDRHAGKEDLSFAGLSPGDGVERRWAAIEDPASPWGGYLRRFYFQGLSPAVRSELVVTVPKGMKLTWELFNGAPQPEVFVAEDRTTYVFRATDVGPFVPEPAAAPAEEQIPFVVVAADIDQALAWRTNLLSIRPSPKPSQKLAAFAERTVEGARGRDAIERLFRWVLDEVAVGPGRNPEQILAKRRGSRSRLLVALVRSLGIPAQLCVARAGTEAAIANPGPSTNWFESVLVRIGETEPIWAGLDDSSPFFGATPPWFRGGRYLLDEGKAPKPRAFREADIARWPLASEADLEVTADGHARGTLSITLPGGYGAALRAFVDEARKEEVLQHFQGWAGAIVPGARVSDVTAENVDDALLPLAIRAQVEVKNFMTLEGGRLVREELFEEPIALRSLGLPQLADYLRTPRRISALMPVEVEEKMEIVLRLPSEDYMVVAGPKNAKRITSFGRFEQRLSLDGSELRLTRLSSIGGGRISPKQFGEFRKHAEAWLETTRGQLIVEPRGPTKTSARAGP